MKPVNYTVVQWPTETNLVQPGDSVTLNCSIISDSSTWSCPSEHSVSWFGVRKDTFDGNVIYTDKNRPFKCDRKRDTAAPSKSCIYYFAKNVSSSDSGTYYCALATCGEIIFGTGTKLEIGGKCTVFKKKNVCKCVILRDTNINEKLIKIKSMHVKYNLLFHLWLFFNTKVNMCVCVLAASESSFGVLQPDVSALPLIWTVLTFTVLICLFLLIIEKFNSCKGNATYFTT